MIKKSGIHWISDVLIKPGAAAEFKGHLEKQISDVKATEPRTMEYLAYMGADGRRCQVVQWFADVDAAVHHLNGEAAKATGRLFELAELVCLWLYVGADEEKVTSIFDGWGIGDKVVKSRLVGGFERWPYEA